MPKPTIVNDSATYESLNHEVSIPQEEGLTPCTASNIFKPSIGFLPALTVTCDGQRFPHVEAQP